MPPTSMKAVFVVGPGQVKVKNNVPIPNPGPGEVLVKVFAVAQNPADWKTVDIKSDVGDAVGLDFAGEVEKLGAGVEDVSVGDRVASFVLGGITGEHGSFAEYTVARVGLLIRIPPSLSWEKAAGIPVGGITACQVLYQSLGFPVPLAQEETSRGSILIWSGASGVGQFAVQLATLGGLEVFTAASPKHHALLRTLGAKACFDYRDIDVGKKIREASGGKLKHAVDCVGGEEAARQISDALSPEGGKVANITQVVPSPPVRPGVDTVYSTVCTLVPTTLTWPIHLPTINETHVAAGKIYAKFLSELLAHEPPRLQAVSPKVLPKGLASVVEGLKLHKEGGVSGVKLTYRIADTP